MFPEKECLGIGGYLTNIYLHRYKRPFDKGNLYINFKVKFPDAHWTTAPQLAALESILPARAPLPDMSGKECEDVVLTTVDPLQQQANARRYQDMEEDEDEQGGPGVQCAQQ